MAEIVAAPSSNGPMFLLGGLLKDHGADFKGFEDVQNPMPQFPPNVGRVLFSITIKGLKVPPAHFFAAAADAPVRQSDTKLVPFETASGDHSGVFIFRPGQEADTWVTEMQTLIDVSGLWLFFQMDNSHEDVAINWFPRWTLDAYRTG